MYLVITCPLTPLRNLPDRRILIGHQSTGSLIVQCFSSTSVSGETVDALFISTCFFSLSSPRLYLSSTNLLLIVLLVLKPPLLADRHDDQTHPMVKLSLISPKGNQGVRYFPYQGYLGLTPLRFEGRAYSPLPFLPHPSHSNPSSKSCAHRSNKTVNPSLQKTSSLQSDAMNHATVASQRYKQTSSTSTQSPFGRNRTLRSGRRSAILNVRSVSLSLPTSPHPAPHCTFKNIEYFGVSRQASAS